MVPIIVLKKDIGESMIRNVSTRYIIENLYIYLINNYECFFRTNYSYYGNLCGNYGIKVNFSLYRYILIYIYTNLETK